MQCRILANFHPLWPVSARKGFRGVIRLMRLRADPYYAEGKRYMLSLDVDGSQVMIHLYHLTIAHLLAFPNWDS